MKISKLLKAAGVVLLSVAVMAQAPKKTREQLWEAVEEAREKDQPKTEMGLLEEIEEAAFAAEAWGEGTRALARRLVLEGKIEGSKAITVKRLDEVLEEAPEPARPVLQVLAARWLHQYYQSNRWRFAQRGTTAGPRGEDLETWSLEQILSEIDARYRTALEAGERLKQQPVGAFAEVMVDGELGDDYRPTMYDFLAHAALDFYEMEEVAVARPVDAFEVEADSPALGTVEAFLGWEPEGADAESPKRRALAILQDLIAFHRGDEDQTAFLHCDLERLRWAGGIAVGENADARYEAALRDFIETHAAHPLSARARLDLGELLRGDEKLVEAHEVLSAGVEAFPDHPFGKLCRDEVAEIERREISLTTESQWTPAGEEIQVLHRNLGRAWFRLYRRDFEVGRPVLDQDPVPQRDGELARLVEGEPLREWSVELKDEGDFKQRTSWFDAPADLEPGFYLLVASAGEDFAAEDNALSVAGVHVGGVALVVRAHERRQLAGFVVDAVSGEPLEGIEVTTLLQHGGAFRKREVKSDAAGYFKVEKHGNANRFLVVARRGDERAVARGWGGYGRGDTKPFERVVFFTDRAIYRPGQTVHFKGILCRVDRKGGEYGVIKERTGTVVLRDPNGKEAAKVEVKSNARGSFAGTFTAPEGSVLGMCRLEFDGLNGAVGIRVEEYKRPKFFAEVKPPAEEAALGEQVRVTARAESYTGAAIDGAKVEWRVTRVVRFPAWLRYCWWFPIPNTSQEEIAHGTVETNPAGEVELAFTARPDESVPEDSEPVFEYRVHVDVTDRTGETRSATRVVSVAYTSLRASVTASGWLEAGEELEFTVRTESHDGEGRAAEGVLKVHRLKEPESCPRPEWNTGRYVRPQEGAEGRPSTDPARWEPGEVVAEIEVETGEDGTATVKRALEAGAYRLVFETRDAGGREIKALNGIQVVDPEAGDFPTMVPFHTAAPAWSVEPGEVAKVLWGSGHEEVRALVEWWLDGRLLKREWSRPGRTQQMFEMAIEERFRGGLSVKVWQVAENRLSVLQREVEVPWTTKELALRWERIVSKLEPGTKETWTAVISGPGGEAAAAEMVATLYDASLDAFAPHRFQALRSLLRQEGGSYGQHAFASEPQGLRQLIAFAPMDHFALGRPFREFRPELIGASNPLLLRQRLAGAVGGGFGRGMAEASLATDALAAAPGAPVEEADRAADKQSRRKAAKDGGGAEPALDLSQVAARTNLEETAFFLPQVTSGEDGTVRMSFTIPEALTTWRFIGLAHDAELRSGMLGGETVTAKELMVQPNPPRFLREGDQLEFTVKVLNQSEVDQEGVIRLSLLDAATDEDRTKRLGVGEPERSFTVAAKQSVTLSWRLKVPDMAGFLKYRAVASTGKLSDGEEGWLPVIPRRILVTESKSLPIRGKGSKEFELEALLKSRGSDTLDSRFLELEVVSQPAWYAVMALPYLMESPHPSADSIFNRYYANALARKIANSDPKIRRIFDLWKAGGEALDSPLMKNEDLKGILLEETPWLARGEDEAAARRRVGLLFDENHMDRELRRALVELNELQGADGLWPWCPGGRANEYISLRIVTGFARLRQLGVETDITAALKALPALDRALTRRYEEIRDHGDLDDSHISPWIALHLYTRTMFLKDVALQGADEVAFDYFVENGREHWTDLGTRMSRAHLALALHRLGDEEVPALVTRSLRENAVNTEELGMHWKNDAAEGWWWWHAPIESQAMMIEAFRAIDGDAEAVEDCRVWLLKQKQVQDWRTTKATADAVWSLLMGGRKLLSSDELLQVSLGGEKVEPQGVEPGTGFYQVRYPAAEVKPRMGRIELRKRDEGVAWASVHWQFLEDMAKVPASEGEQLQLEKSLYIRENTDQGPRLVPVDGPVEVGDELVTRVVLRNDRAMEFVHLKDLRGSGTEPVNVLSGYRWQDGFGYYEVTRDTAGHFFIDRLPEGTHVFETSVRVQHAGEYQTGIAEVRCLYAPEFAARSGSVAVVAE